MWGKHFLVVIGLQKEETTSVADIPRLKCKNCGKEVSKAVLVRTKAASGRVIREEILCESCYRKTNGKRDFSAKVQVRRIRYGKGTLTITDKYLHLNYKKFLSKR